MTALLANHSMSRLQASRLGPFVVAAATFVLTYACVMLPRGDGGVASIWAPNAVLVAVMLRSPRAKWIAYLSMGAIGMLAGNFAADGAAPLKSLVLAGCN